VACAHGATIGTIDPDQIFYAQSRGLSPAAAQALLIDAFVRGHLPVLSPDLQTIIDTALTAPIAEES
jgi:Fe-S cluster assembly protein SufD